MLGKALRAFMLGALLGLPLVALVVHKSRQHNYPILASPTKLMPMAPSEDPVEPRIGQMLFSPLEGDICKRSNFDNRTGAIAEAGEVNCSHAMQSITPSVAMGRVQSVSKAFRR